MVHQSSNKSKAIKPKPSYVLFFVLLFIFIAAITYIMIIIFFDKPSVIEDSNMNNDNAESSLEPETAEPGVEEPEYLRINFQPIVDNWVNSLGGNKSVLIYDVENDSLVGSYNPDESYNTASLYKLFVVYEGYRRVESEEWDGTAIAGSTGHTILECLDLAIRESYSPCAETLWSMIGRDELDRIIVKDYNIVNSDISRLISNPTDILSIMKLFYTHNDISDETLITRMKDSFLNQPATTYNWRQGLPSGFTRANVYNKVGWDFNPDGRYWNIYHDTSIVEFPEENRHYIIVVMTNRVDFKNIKNLGSMIENYYYESISAEKL